MLAKCSSNFVIHRVWGVYAANTIIECIEKHQRVIDEITFHEQLYENRCVDDKIGHMLCRIFLSFPLVTNQSHQIGSGCRAAWTLGEIAANLGHCFHVSFASSFTFCRLLHEFNDEAAQRDAA